eukprot:CAMPEP_0197699786 /NCGR_PEP_ID=MMETSP1338-20131121/121071_1 /TAXON_ID=43686 ORGANISM="Pelagodinium beii, Strain RCC1491" /NCGR_SAMPLE_ID=MMETSP1338 /ASSEMBLY_ACC=CAM_ASM_000754 /LENGTH=137 /DNA_ID=CAMNT_0043283313 /DNA_START=63 /DNA_END=476 /DNA_ORIENTATION=-
MPCAEHPKAMPLARRLCRKPSKEKSGSRITTPNKPENVVMATARAAGAPSTSATPIATGDIAQRDTAAKASGRGSARIRIMTGTLLMVKQVDTSAVSVIARRSRRSSDRFSKRRSPRDTTVVGSRKLSKAPPPGHML